MHKDNKGFTLVELVVSVALLAIILVPASKFFMDSFRVQSRTAMRTSITRVSQYIMENLRNENYLETNGENPSLTNETGDFKDFLGKITLDKVGEKYQFNSSSGVNPTDVKSWNIKYKGEDYIVKMSLPSFTVSDMKDFEIPTNFDCEVSLDEDGKFFNISSDLLNMETVNIDNIVNNPIASKNGKNPTFKADYPTIVFKDDNIQGNISLLINNQWKEKDNVWNTIRIIKSFKNKLEVYIQGNHLIIQDSKEADGATYEQSKFTSIYIGQDASKSKKENESKIILEAKMEVISKKDPVIKDVFEFSFPIKYDYSKNEANMLELVIE